MRKIYLLFCGFLISVCLQSQNVVNKAFHEYNDEGHHLIHFNNNYYFTSNVYTDGFLDTCLISSLDSLGTLRFRRVINKNEYTEFTRIIKTLDNRIVLIGLAHGCDLVDASQRTFIIKMDENGNTEFDNTFAGVESTSGFADHLIDIVQYTDSSYFAITDSLLFHFSKYGTTLSRKNTGLSGLVSINPRGDGKLNLTTNSLLLNVVIDTAATIISQYNLNGPANKTFVLDTNHIYTLNKIISKRNTVMQLLNTSTVAQDSLSGNIISDFTFKNDTIYACGYNLLDSNSFVLLLDTNLNLIAIKVNNTTRVKPVSIAYEDKISILINSNSYPSQNGIIGVYSFQKNEDYVFSEDIGVTEVLVDSGYVTYTTMFYPPTNSYVYSMNTKYYKARAVVMNHGVIPVAKLQINSLTYPYGFCGNSFFVKPIDSLNLLPGQTDTLNIGWITSDVSMMPQPSLPTTFPASLCLNTSIPNQKHDKNSNNDGVCTNVSLQVIGLKEMKEEISLNLFPNPVNNMLSIKTDAFIAQIIIQDVAGRKVEQWELNKVNECEINLSNLESGIYFIEIETTKGIVVRKIIKQ